MNLNRHLALWAAMGVVAVSSSALGQAAAGVSDERVNLPEAPGSIDGVGENASTEGNQGTVNYKVSVDVPDGFDGLTPMVDLNYSSGGGSDILGIGWSMSNFSIERMTSKGLQKYDVDDRFVADGSDELVRVSTGTDAVYRLRFEGSFIRYTWKSRGTGEGGYWLAEFPDGRMGYYGADENGVEVPTARITVPTSTRTFRYHLVAMSDRFGHFMRLSWTKDAGGTSLLERIDYLQDGASARHSVRFTYETRNDQLSDARPGFELKLNSRLKDIRIFSGTELMRSYVMNYEAEMVSGGASRLASVARFGRGGVQYPVTFNFQYSKTLGGACDATCEKPFVKDMGSLGVNFGTGRATLIDINGDALPDVLSSDTQGAHSFFYARLDADGRVSFSSTPTPSTRTTGGSAFVLGDPRVQVIDVNGDGFVDITQAKVPTLLCNNGSGDWAPATFCSGSAPGLPSSFSPEDDTGDATQADPKFVRFFDYDNDKRIDWLRTPAGASSTEVLANTPAGFTSVLVDNIGAVFDDEPLQLADMNGDGLQDPVKLLVSGSLITVQYRLNLGFGKWAPWRNLSVDFGDATQASLAEVQDINGDTLADLVSVVGNTVKLSLNRNGDRFDAVQTINQASVGQGTVPTRLTDTVIAYADMNGNGSDDIVWLQANGAISYLELFPVRPNLISRIDNGIGAVQTFKYGTSIAEQARDAAATMPWNNRVPNPMTVVTRVVNFVTLTGNDTNGTVDPTGLLNITNFQYHSGYYDGVEKQFRGYEAVERELVSDMSRDAQEPALTVERYDVGKTNPALAGVGVNTLIYAGPAGNRVLLRESRNEWQVCPVADVPMGTTPAISFACERATTDVLVERDAANAVTTRTEKEYDGYGNVTRIRDLGVINLGTPENPTACGACTASGVFGQACGMMCLGDENFAEADFLTPGTATGNAWLVGFETREASGPTATSMIEETLTYYDGAEFQGLALGQATKGAVTRVERRTGAGATDFITVDRFKRDTHGNVLESIEANGSIGDTTKHRRLYTYEAAGLNTLSVEIRTGGTGVTGIKRDQIYDTIFEVVSQSSNWYPINGTMPLASAQQTRYRYDEHGRVSKILEPGDTDMSPGQEFTYSLMSPASKITIAERSTANGAQDIITARCLDGRGRVFQERAQISSNSFLVDGFVEFDGKGAVVRRYQPYLSTSAACETMAPANVPFTSFTYDAVGRVLSSTEADGSIRKVEYRPLKGLFYDEDDTDSSSPFANTPDVETYDGLARIVSLSRVLSSGGSPSVTTFTYDAQGFMSTVRDPSGNVRTQTYDRLGRLTRLDDTNSGSTSMEYDNNGNETKRTDARGVVLKSEYDGANRITAHYVEGDDAATRRTWAYDFLMGCTECTNAGAETVSVSWPGAWGGGDRFGYDPKGNLVYNQRTIAGVNFVIRRRYDGADREVGVNYPGGLAIDATYDPAGRLTSIPSVVNSIAYNDRGELGTLNFANGVSTALTYDAKLRLASLTTSSSAGPLLQLGFTRNKSGELQSLSDGALAGHVRHDGTFTHDAWGRLTKAVLTNGSGTETLDLAYDAIDNMTSKTSSLGASSRAHVGALTYASTRPNAVADAAGIARTYDATGNLTGKGGITYTRDFMNRVATASGGKSEGSYFYDDLDRLVKVEGDSVTMFVDDDFELHDGISVAYARVGEDRVARLETDSLAAVVLSDLAPLTGSTPNGDGTIDIADAWIAQAASAGVQTLSGGPTPSPVGYLLSSAARRLLMEDIMWLHNDHLSSTVLATDANGAVRGEQSFYPTGEVRETLGYVDETGFTGQVFDEATGMIHFRYRELDATSGRWDRPDPSFEELDEDNVRSFGEATAGYAYVGNAFVDANDPTGLKTTKSGSGGGKKAAKSGGTKAKTNTNAKKGTAQGKKNAQGKAKGGSRTGARAALIAQIVASAISAVLSVISAIGQTDAAGDGDNAQAFRYGAVGAVGAGFGALGSGIGAGRDLKQEFGAGTGSGKSGSGSQPKGGATGGGKSGGTKKGAPKGTKATNGKKQQGTTVKTGSKSTAKKTNTKTTSKSKITWGPNGPPKASSQPQPSKASSSGSSTGTNSTTGTTGGIK